MTLCYSAKVPDALCYQTHAEAFEALTAIKELCMLLEVRGYWIVLRRSALDESIKAIDNLEAERLEHLRLIEEAKQAQAEVPPTATVKEAKHGQTRR